MAKATDHIINISFYEQNAAIKRGIPKHMMSVLYNAVEWTPLPERAPFCDSSGAPLTVLFVGRLDRQKGVDIAFDVLRLVQGRPVKLWVIGASVVDGTVPSAPENVGYLGWLPRESVRAWYKRADLLLVPSRWEGFGMVVIEAMRAGLPVLASNRGALPEVLGDGGWLFDPTRPATAAQLLARLTPEELSAASAKGRARFESVFVRERLTKQLCELYQSLLDGK